MWSNIGHKIKTLAKVICWIGIVLSVIAGIAVIAGGSAVRSYGYTYNTGSATLTGILVIILGVLGSWLGSLTMYGFAAGEKKDVQQYRTENQNPRHGDLLAGDGAGCDHCRVRHV